MTTDRDGSHPAATSLPRVPRAWRSPRAWTLLLTVVCLGLVADFWTKSWSFANVADTPVELNREELLTHPGWTPIPVHEGYPALPWGLLEFRLVLNRGAVFGIGPTKRVFFIAFTLVALIGGLFLFGRMTSARHRVAHIGIGLILAGGLGNLYDRIFIGRVRDFLHMLPDWHLPFGLRWGRGGSPEVFPWVFNIADVSLLVGMGLLMIHINRQEKKRKLRELAEQAAAEGSPSDGTAAAAG